MRRDLDALEVFVRAELGSFTQAAQQPGMLGERCIRHEVMYRKTSFGTQSEEGSRFVERIFTAPWLGGCTASTSPARGASSAPTPEQWKSPLYRDHPLVGRIWDTRAGHESRAAEGPRQVIREGGLG
ncbi:hypothetical protein ACN28S_38285 [Cystobacter fuscus]